MSSNNNLNVKKIFYHIFYRHILLLHFKMMLIRLRLCFHGLLSETGIYHTIPYNHKISKLCNMQVVENEYRFVVVWPVYRDLRQLYIR